MADAVAGCRRVLTDDTTDLLRGSAAADPRCEWLDAVALQVLIGPQTSLQIGDTLSIRPGVIHPLAIDSIPLLGCAAPLSGANMCSNGSASVGLPSDPLPPLALVTAPTHLSICDDLILDGSGSSGGGIYQLKYYWNVTYVGAASVNAPGGEPALVDDGGAVGTDTNGSGANSTAYTSSGTLASNRGVREELTAALRRLLEAYNDTADVVKIPALAIPEGLIVFSLQVPSFRFNPETPVTLPSRPPALHRVLHHALHAPRCRSSASSEELASKPLPVSRNRQASSLPPPSKVVLLPRSLCGRSSSQ